MTRGRRSAEDRAGLRLLELWQRRPEDGDPIGCVATTYTFDPAHFEEHCIARFVGMQSDPAEDARGYFIEREEKLAQVFAGVLVDQAHVSAQRSLRWHLLPVRVDGGGCLHAKVSLLAWEHRIRVIVASANLTEPGYRRNLENAACLDFTPRGETPHAVLDDVVAFLDDVRRRAPGVDLSEGPQPALDAFLRSVVARVHTWTSPAPKRGEPSARFVATGPGSPNLFTRLGELWQGPRPRDAWVVSPFYDEYDGALDTMTGLEGLMSQRGDRTVHLMTSGQRLPDGIVQLDLPACLEKVGQGRAARRFYMVTPDPCDGMRALHAKSLWLERDGRALFCVGSSNFTRAGTAHRTHGPVNLEANVVYTLPDVDDDFGKVCQMAYPCYVELDPEEEDICFLATTDKTPEPEGFVALPAAFGSALFRVRDGATELDLELVAPPPSGVAVRTNEGAVLPVAIDGTDEWPHHTVLSWPETRPPSHLRVEWVDGAGPRVAIWAVNVASGADLPPPDELRALTLEELVEVLMSARPLHEAVARVVRRRQEGAATAAQVDPHRKIDTRHFLLKRMRRISAAFEELRARLERPMHTRDALWWRLRGPLGPIALARVIAAEEPTSAGFQLAELGLTFRDLRLQPQGELSLDEVRHAVADVIEDLRQMAGAHPAPPNLAAYVARTFAEIAR